MNARLFYLIHNERGYKRYYCQPLPKDTCLGRCLFEIKQYARLFVESILLPFNTKYNTSQYPIGEGGAKSKVRQLFECVGWMLRYKEVCYYYYLWGLDLKEHSPKDYMAYTEFRVLRNILNIRQRENKLTNYTFNYLALSRDKFCFCQYAKSLGFPVPATIALVSSGKISFSDGCSFSKFENLSAILLHGNFSAFAKETTGEGGRGAFALDVVDSAILINGTKSSLEELAGMFGNSSFILQQRIANHPDIAQLYPYSVNTVRVVTVAKDGQIHLFDARLRTGANGSVVDNACFGGVVIGINKNGTLTDWGYREPGKTADKNLIVQQSHPDTGFRFAGMQVPFWNEVLQNAIEFHRFYYGIPSMGWDVAITEKGPVFLECGEDWEIQGTQIFNGGRRKDFYELHADALSIRLRKI